MKKLPLFVSLVGFVLLYSVLRGLVHESSQLEEFRNEPGHSSAGVTIEEQTGRATHTAPSSTANSSSACFYPRLNADIARLASIRICFDPEACTGSLTVHAFDCSKDVPSSVSNDLEISQELMRQWGPDLFRLRVEGPEIFSSLSSPLDSTCFYSFPLEMHREGSYNVAVEWLYKQYDAINEAFSRWPSLMKKPLLPVNASDNNYHRQQRTLESTLFLTCSRTRVRPSLSQCTGRELAHSGRWVRSPGNSFMHTRVRVRKLSRSPIVFKWSIQNEPFARWAPDLCNSDVEDVSTDLEHLSRKRVCIAGDSQSRALYFGLMNDLNGKGNLCVQNLTAEASEPSDCIANVKGSHRRQFRDAQFDFYDDPFLDRFSSGKFDGYDVVIIGFAQHPASKEHWPFRRFRLATDNKVRKIEKLMGKGKHIVWFLAPQFPHTVDGYPVTVRDWRTDARISTFNSYVKQSLPSGVPILDGFSVTAPMSHTSPDQAHYTNFVSYELVQMLRSILRGLPLTREVVH